MIVYLSAAAILIVGFTPLALAVRAEIRKRRAAREAALPRPRRPIPSVDDLLAKARANAGTIELREARPDDRGQVEEDDGAGPI